VAEYADEVYFIRAGIPSLIKKRNRRPFKLGAPSYILPTGYIENVTYLIDHVEDIQLLLFDSMPDDPLFKDETLSTLQYLVKESEITFSPHMPTSPKVLNDFDGALKRDRQIIKALEPLPVSALTFHYDLPDGKTWEDLKEAEIKEIDETYIRYFKLLKEEFPSIRMALENTATPLSALDNVVEGAGIFYCIDIGHLMVQGREVSEVESRLTKAVVIHFHGWEEIDGKRKDHRAVIYDRKIFKMLEKFSGVLTIENYHKRIFEKSKGFINDYF
jgi:sugar phosphate isomerase/epimerase